MSLKERLHQLRGQRGEAETERPSGRSPVAERAARLRAGGEGQRGSPSGESGATDLADALGGRWVAPGLARVDHFEGAGATPGEAELAGLPEAEGVDPRRALFLDTETTGLAGGTGTVAFMVGVARPGKEGLTTTQLTLTGMAGEAALLEEVASLAAGAEAVVTYNGKRFDLPLLATRFRLHGLADPLSERAHLDLLYPVRRLFRRRWPDCRLTTAEERLLGHRRRGDLPGAEAPEAWRDFLRSGRPGRVPEVARHNRRDLLSLAQLLPALAGGHRAPWPAGADPLAAARSRLAAGDEAGARALLADSEGGLGRDGVLELARLHRRAGDFEAARRLWTGLAEAGCPVAMEHLAKHYEHRERDPGRALAWAERLPPGPEHDRRRQRLRAKHAPGAC